jgi:hypothetical protein
MVGQSLKVFSFVQLHIKSKKFLHLSIISLDQIDPNLLWSTLTTTMVGKIFNFDVLAQVIV